MSKIDELISIYEELDSPHEPVRKQVKIQYDKIKKDIESELSKIEEYKKCKQYWYDKYQDTL